jgi:hypothetical protein
MSTARNSLEHHASAAGHRDQATRHYHRAPKLFEKNHAYAARLVQIASAIRSAPRSPVTMNLPDRVPSEVEGDDTITTGIVGPPRTPGSGP